MIFIQIFFVLVAFILIMGLVTVLAALFGFSRAMRNLRRNPSATAREAENGSTIFEARPCPHCGTYLSEPPQDGHCPFCGKNV